MSLEKAKQNFKIQQERDKRKNVLCQQYRIKLLRIKYTEDIEQKIMHSCRIIKGELEVVNYLKSKGVYVIERDRKILGGKELDIFIPNKEWVERANL